MRLVWHIVAKDLRRMALPLGLWLGLIVAGAIWFQWMPLAVDGHAGSEIDAWLRTMQIWTGLLLAVQLLMGYLLTGTLGLEDPLVGSGEFWMTRPIERARLFAAKVTAVVLLFVVAPAVVLVPVWFATGFTLHDVWHASGELALRHGLLAILALTLASLVRSLAYYLLSTVLVALVYLVAGSLLWRLAGVAWPYVAASAATAAVFAFVVQFLTGRVARSRWLLAATLTACGLATAGWPLMFGGPWNAARTPTRPTANVAQRDAEVPTAAIEVDALFTVTKYRANSIPTLNVTTAWSPDAFYAPTIVQQSDGKVALSPGLSWGSEAGQRALGFGLEETPLRWQLMPYPIRPGHYVESVEGELEIWRARAVIVGEVPLQVGSELSEQTVRTRVIEIGRNDGRIDAIYIEECRASTAMDGYWRNSSLDWARGSQDHVALFYLVDRTGPRVLSMSAQVVGFVRLDAIGRGIRRLSFGGGGDWSGSNLVKVRIERLGSFHRPISATGVKIRTP